MWGNISRDSFLSFRRTFPFPLPPPLPPVSPPSVPPVLVSFFRFFLSSRDCRLRRWRLIVRFFSASMELPYLLLRLRTVWSAPIVSNSRKNPHRRRKGPFPFFVLVSCEVKRSIVVQLLQSKFWCQRSLLSFMGARWNGFLHFSCAG